MKSLVFGSGTVRVRPDPVFGSFNLPAQQKSSLDEILKTEQEFQQVIVGLDKDSELKLIQREAIAEVIRSLEARAKKTASLMTPARFYTTLLGAGFPQRPWTFEEGETRWGQAVTKAS